MVFDITRPCKLHAGHFVCDTMFILPRRLSLFFLTALLAVSVKGISQSVRLKGTVVNPSGQALSGANILIDETHGATVTNGKGIFIFNGLKPGSYHIHISFIGYRCVHHMPLQLRSDTAIRFEMQPDEVKLQETEIVGIGPGQNDHVQPLTVVVADKNLMEERRGANLMQSLSTLPGISRMSIGEGTAKPVIRGMAFNRIVVADNGLKQEGQQWGADHGLEIDQFGIDRAEVIKGPASLAYGSDALGGVIELKPAPLPGPGEFQGNVTLLGRSVNDYIATSAGGTYRGQNYYFRFRGTVADYGDYRVPADSFYYNSYHLPISGRYLKNTAGSEKNFSATIGHINSWHNHSLTISQVDSKSGFFPGAHGIPNLNSLASDSNRRDVDLPYQAVSHTKIMSLARWQTDRSMTEFQVGYQRNLRREFSSPHTHGLEPMPEGDLEFEFLLQTAQSTFKYRRNTGPYIVSAGADAQFQHNRRGGYSFLLPDFERYTGGFFATAERHLNQRLSFSAGIRYDVGHIHIHRFVDPNISQVIQDPELAARYSERSPEISRTWGDLSWSAGLDYHPDDHWTIKAGIGKSFRMPGAIELSANGVHHGSFRHEQGNASLTSETAYQADLSASYTNQKLKLSLSPFVSYLPGYIFLNPTGEWSYLPDAGQIWRYEQSESLRWGGEATAQWNAARWLNLDASADYVWAQDLETSYPSPLTPPASINPSAEFIIGWLHRADRPGKFRISGSWKMAQNRVARNEAATPGYFLTDLSWTEKIMPGNHLFITFVAGINNLFDVHYKDHLSFYRLIELPEAGRNIQISLVFSINE